MATAARPIGPKTRKGWVARTNPAPTKSISSSDIADSAYALRLQRLMRLGVIGHRADLVATLAWGEAA